MFEEMEFFSHATRIAHWRDARSSAARGVHSPHERLKYGMAEGAWVRSLPIAKLCGNDRGDMNFGHFNSVRVG